MKKLLILILLVGIYINLYASIDSVYHPKNEPKGLYLVIMVEAGERQVIYRDYRLYCPNLTIREITDGKKRKAYKVKDILHLHDLDFYSDIKTICNHKKHIVYKDGVIVKATQRWSYCKSYSS